ncbi:DEAD/DEAH box helicase family protein [Desulfallas sp. Bu1-1]|uniref:DEAD/DEAH box helicase family protein n=1 Tax=Desulfallas sp. Bu1-1 TaxID=2787620 RepID=UPI00189E4FF1|nr:DEAD/DEAH box helicase family protein [Desulfallas sp. Bu1-1]MBF7081854.1 DEAD/DEAH box helicase family protein [Desulfallas sp. Bu1-1]
MGLKDVEIKNEYRSLIDKVAQEFYIPLLQHAISYKRAVGFFSSSILVEISKGISALVKNGGSIQLVASPYLSDDDIEAIRTGYALRDSIIKSSVLRQLKDPKTPFEKERLNMLANLIADGILDIKIAFTEDESKMGMYHEKMGIISDGMGNKVAFSGSMNESANALNANYETIDVFCSWKSEHENERVKAKENAFTAIWNNSEPNIRIIEFPELKQEIIERYKNAPPNFNIDKEEFESLLIGKDKKKTKRLGAVIPESVTLHDYQKEAIEAWALNGFRGIFDMATGTGKTFTGLGAVARLCEETDNHLAVVIVCPYQHLVEQWVEDIELFGMKPIIGYSASNQKDWKARLENAIRDQKLKVRNREFFCFVCTNATFSSPYVQSQIAKIRGDALLMVDEAHNFGAENLSRLLSDKFNYRLALSATIDRHNDAEGTQRIRDYFGQKCIEYTLERAIEENKLTRYKYYPVICTLNEAELQRYNELTYEIGKCIINDKRGKKRLNEKGKILALARARLIAGAEDKITKLEEKIKPYINSNRILVYCGATKILQSGQDSTEIDDDDIRQIDVVTDLLGNKLNMKVSQFTSKEDIAERAILKREFSEGNTLQVLIAIKCLDEGVNIPKISTAFILASTTNPKEYIQRRGRVLRLAEGKEFAEIYDFITLPYGLDDVYSLTESQLKKTMSLVRNELSRAEEFARLAMNMIEAQNVLDGIKEAYVINDNIITFEEEFEYDGC